MNSDLNLSKKCILYIDDNAASIEAALAIFEDDYNYSIISEISVEEGLETVNNYYGTIDAIILDLSFPDTKIQGKEGLIILKEKYGWIPVFILTGSTDSKENAIAQECLALGAEQVFHKDVFDVQVFMNQVTDAAHRENISQQLKSLKDYTSRAVESPYLHLVDCETYFNGVFAFKLKTVFSEVDNSAYELWTNELVQVVALFKNIEVAQIYRNENGKIACYFRFILAGETEGDVLKLYKDFYFNISSFFNDQFIYQPVNFYPITDSIVVAQLIIAGRLDEMAQTYDFVRNHKEITTDNNSIGFNSSNLTNDKYAVPLPLEEAIVDYDVLFHHLRTIPEIVFMHMFIPMRLTVKEIEFLNKAKRTFTGTGLEAYKNSAMRFLDNQRALFTLKTVCVLPRRKIQTILTLINNGFYNGKTKPVTSIKSNWSNYMTNLVRLNYALPASDISKVIKLPAIKASNQTIFKIERLTHQYIPDSAYQNTNVTIGEKETKPIGLEPKQFQKHTYIIGKTGTGKTSILKTMIQNRMESGDGLALIDPHGDIYKKVLEAVPENRKKDIILFDPANPDNTFGFNFFKYNKDFPEQQGFIVTELIKIFGDIYNLTTTGGPMFEMYFKNAAYLAMETIEEPVLDDIARIFQKPTVLEICLEKSQNDRVISFFRAAQESVGEMSLANFTNYIASKLTRFTDNPLLRNVLCDPKKDVDFRALMDEGKIFLVKLNKGRLGSEGVGFIGKLLFNKLIMSAYTRENIPENERREFSIFIDEFQNFTSGDIVSALGEVRKYKLQLILANQTFAQLDEKVARNILGNVGSIITAAVSPYDAEMIAPFVEPEFTKQDIVQLDNYKFILNTQYNNKRVSPFIFNSIPY
jgi:CheY-like chemotaxis protein